MLREIKPFEISDKEIKEVVFLKERYRTVFYEGMVSKKDLEDLEKIPSNDCTSSTKELFTSILQKYSKLYEKNFEEPINELRRYEESNISLNHRDHICHLFRVWGIGQILFKHGFFRYFPKLKEGQEDFDFVWCLATLYHDVGYAKYSKKRGEKHGKCGSKILSKCLEEFEHRTCQKCSPHATLAVNAISLHDCEESVDIKKDPYSALLIICDELQEFGRNIQGKEVNAEIRKMDIFLNLNAPSSTMHVEMLYPRNQPTSKNNIDAETSEKEKKLNALFEKRIHNLSITVHTKLC